jgi:hypothetical protein
MEDTHANPYVVAAGFVYTNAAELVTIIVAFCHHLITVDASLWTTGFGILAFFGGVVKATCAGMATHVGKIVLDKYFINKNNNKS